MSLSVGIVGLPNVGKSTLFNALLKRQAALAANYPFATIEPNTGIVAVPDERLEILAKVVHTEVIKPATVEFVDIAGLVKGASKGEGLGNQFLSHIRQVDVIVHVVRGFKDENVIREGSVDPKTDRETIETELLLADLATLEKQKEPRANEGKDMIEKWNVIKKFQTTANDGMLISTVIVGEDDARIARELGLLTAKPMIYVVNVDEDQVGNPETKAKVAKELIVLENNVVVICAQIESELASLDIADQKAYLHDLGLEQSGLERLIQKAYQLLGLQSFLTAGEKEVRAWTIQKGTTAQMAAGVIHTDFSKKFIKAHIASFEDFVADQGWKNLRDKGKVRQEGRDYIMQEGDVVEFAIGA